MFLEIQLAGRFMPNLLKMVMQVKIMYKSGLKSYHTQKSKPLAFGCFRKKAQLQVTMASSVRTVFILTPKSLKDTCGKNQ